MELDTKKELLHWVSERESVRIKKEAGLPKPWTNDPVLRDYKFCNVRREDDTVSKWVMNNWLFPYADHKNVAFAMAVARHINWPDTLAIIGFPEVWEPEVVRAKMKAYREAGNKVYTGAYMISTNGISMDKVDYSIDRVLTPLYNAITPPKEGISLQEYCAYLQQFNGFSSFMAGQVIADLKWIEPLKSAKDWNTWTPLGPGSIRGLNRFFGRPLAYNVKQAQGTIELLQIQKIISEELNMSVELHNVQNCMCEFDKYIRIRYDGGKVRSKYNGRG